MTWVAAAPRLTQLFCQQSATIHWDHSLLFHIALISSQHHLCIIPRVGFYLGWPGRNQKQIQKKKPHHSQTNAVAAFRKNLSGLFLCHFLLGRILKITWHERWQSKGRDVKFVRHLDWSMTAITSPCVWHHVIFESLMAAVEKWVHCCCVLKSCNHY